MAIIGRLGNKIVPDKRKKKSDLLNGEEELEKEKRE